MFQQVATFMLAQVRPRGMADVAQPPAQSKMARGLCARGEVMMVLAFRRNEQASRLPVDAHEFFAGIPRERVALVGDDDDLRAGTMTVSFFVSAGFDGHDVADHRIAREVNAQTAEADAALRVRIERDGAQVGNKINRSVFLLVRIELAAEEIPLTSEAVGEFIRDVEDEIRGVVDIHNQRQVVRRGETHGLGRGTIVVLMPHIGEKNCRIAIRGQSALGSHRSKIGWRPGPTRSVPALRTYAEPV
jgi:hypothetical protein